MEISTLQIIAIFLFSCIAGMGSVLDEFQTHRPLIACTVIGLILGDLKTGIMLGGTLELIALGWMNVGAAQSPDSALASIISAILVIVGHQSIATGIAIALPVAAAGQVLTVFARTITVVFQHAADKAAEDARFRTIDMLHISALGVQALRVAIPALVVSLFVSADMVSNMLNAIPEFVTRGLQIAGGFIVVVGYAMVLRMMGVKYLMPFFFLGFLAGGYLDFSLLAFGGVGVIIALIYIQLNPQWRKAEPRRPPLPPPLTNLTTDGARYGTEKLTQGDLVNIFLRSNLQQASFNFERIHGLGFCYDMIPAIKRLYPLKEDQVAALKRHLVFFNTTPAVCGPVLGVTAAMEEARANGAAIDDGAINGIKVGLMGPLAGVGDPLVWGTLRPITAALGASLALSGTFLGHSLFLYFQCSTSGNEMVRPAAWFP
jgi:PTS system sorbose-specific IIC component